MQLLFESLFNGVAIGSVLLMAALGLAIVSVQQTTNTLWYALTLYQSFYSYSYYIPYWHGQKRM